jgi:predicted metal-dependent peptidase
MTPQDRAAWQLVEQGRFILLEQCAWFEPALLKIVPKLREGLGTVAISRDGIMWCDPATITKWSPREMAGAILHEGLHLWCRHFDRLKGCPPSIVNVANDIADNVMVRGTGLPLPEGAIYPETFGFPEGETSEQYYQRLLDMAEQEKQRQQQGNPFNDDDGCGPPSDDPGDILREAGYSIPDEPVACGGWDGDGAGRPVPGEPKPGEDDASRDEEDLEVGFRAVSDNVQKYQGSLPGGIKLQADITLAPPMISWRERLAYAARCAVRWRPGGRRRGFRDPSVLQWGIGRGPGKPVLATYYDTTPKVCVAIDTSGSMGKGEIQEALSETQGLMKHLRAAIRFIACDAEVHRSIEVKNIQEVVDNLAGGGGTDFCPVFESLEKLQPRERPDVLVFITDGWGSAPDRAPSWCKTIWIVTSGGTEPATWGSIVRMDQKPVRKAA